MQTINTPNPFPLDALPEEIQEMIQAYCTGLNLNVDYSACTVLFTYSVAMGSHYRLKIKNGWIETGSLFMALVGKTGVNKSSPLSIFTSKLEKTDKELFREFDKNYTAFINQDKTDKSKPVIAEPIRRQLIIKDATQEALLKGLYDNKHGFGGIYDELTSFLNSFNKYKSSGGDEELFLSLFSGKSTSVTRRHTRPLYIDDPFLSIIGTIQPEVIVSSFGNNRVENGLTHRFLFAYPDEVLRDDLSDEDVPDDILELFGFVIDRILKPEMLTGEYFTKTLVLSKDAYQYYKMFRRKMNHIINNQKSSAISGIYAKLDTYFLRISLIIHMMRLSCGNEGINDHEVAAGSLERAEKIITYFTNTALKVFALLERHRDPLVDYPQEHKMIYYQLPAHFDTNQAWEIAKLKVSRRTLFNMLNDDYLFTKIRRGVYEKIW